MNTETRFRAWDGKKMYYWDSVDHPATHLITNTPDKKLFYLPMSWLLGDSNDWIWMQYTGLKDKNGKEIYKGDILSNHDNKRYYIAYRKGSYVAQDCFSISDGGDMYKVLYDWGGNSYDGMCYAEIIGNLYETPELLNNKN